MFSIKRCLYAILLLLLSGCLIPVPHKRVSRVGPYEECDHSYHEYSRTLGEKVDSLRFDESTARATFESVCRDVGVVCQTYGGRSSPMEGSEECAKIEIHDASFFDACRMLAPHGYCYVGGDMVADFEKDRDDDSSDEKNVWSLLLPEMKLSGKTIGDVLKDFYHQMMPHVRKAGLQFYLIAVGDSLNKVVSDDCAVPSMRMKDAVLFLAERLGLVFERTDSSVFLVPVDASFTPAKLFKETICVPDLNGQDKFVRLLKEVEVGPVDVVCRSDGADVREVHTAVNEALSVRGEQGLGMIVRGGGDLKVCDGCAVLPRGSIVETCVNLAKVTRSNVSIEQGLLVLDGSAARFPSSGDASSVTQEFIILHDITLLDAVKLILYSNDLDEGLESKGDQLLVSWLGEWDLNRVLDVKIRRSNRIEMCRQLVEAYGCSLQAGEGCLIVRRMPIELAAGCGKF